MPQTDELEDALERFGLVLTDNPDFDHDETTFEAAKKGFVSALRSDRDPAEAENERLREALKEIGEYTGDGGPNTPWRDIVRSLGETARIALQEKRSWA